MRIEEAYWHFRCPDCGFGDTEFGHLAASTDVHCLVCREDGRAVRVRRWVASEPGHVTAPEASAES